MTSYSKKKGASRGNPVPCHDLGPHSTLAQAFPECLFGTILRLRNRTMQKPSPTHHTNQGTTRTNSASYRLQSVASRCSQSTSDGSSASMMRHTLPPMTASWLTFILQIRASLSSHSPVGRQQRDVGKCARTGARYNRGRQHLPQYLVRMPPRARTSILQPQKQIFEKTRRLTLVNTG